VGGLEKKRKMGRTEKARPAQIILIRFYLVVFDGSRRRPDGVLGEGVPYFASAFVFPFLVKSVRTAMPTLPTSIL